MFDVNLIGKPGIQPIKVPDTLSYYNESIFTSKDSNEIPKSKKNKVSTNKILFMGLIVTLSITLIFYFSVLENVSLSSQKNITDRVSSNDKIFTKLKLFLLSNQKYQQTRIIIGKKYIRIYFHSNQNFYDLLIRELENNFGFNARISSNSKNRNYVIFRLPWNTEKKSADFTEIKNLIDDENIINYSFDKNLETIFLSINELYLVDFLDKLYELNIISLFTYDINFEESDTITIKIEKI